MKELLAVNFILEKKTIGVLMSSEDYQLLTQQLNRSRSDFKLVEKNKTYCIHFFELPNKLISSIIINTERYYKSNKSRLDQQFLTELELNIDSIEFIQKLKEGHHF